MAKEKITIPKQQLEIGQIHELKGYSGGKKFLLPVTAVNLSLPEEDPRNGKPLRYTVFQEELQTWIMAKAVGTRFLADIQEVARDASDYGPDLNIVQIYDGGNPVLVKKSGGGGYRSSYDAWSAEGIAAVQEVGAWLRLEKDRVHVQAGALSENYWKAVNKMLDNYLTAPSVPDGVQTRQDAKRSDQAAPQVSKEGKTAEAPIKHVGDLLTRASKLNPPVTTEDIRVAFSVDNPAEIENLEEAWKQIQTMNKTKGRK